mgnify:CR=1 FL=1
MNSITVGGSSGITVTYIKTRRVIRVNGWYDSIVGIEGFELPIDEFLEKLGIKPKKQEGK